MSRNRQKYLTNNYLCIAKNHNMKKIFLFSICLIFFFSCQKDVSDSTLTSDYSNQVVVSWVDLALELAKTTPGFTPPVAARTYGYLSLTMYEAARFGMPGYQSMAGQISNLEPEELPVPTNEEYNWAIVTNAAASEILQACVGAAKVSNNAIILDQYLSNNNRLKQGIDNSTLERSIAFGKKLGNAMVLYTTSDGQIECFKNNFPSNFVLATGLGFWEPTSAQLIPLQPYWGAVRTFVNENRNIAVEQPLAYSTEANSAFYKEAFEVYSTLKNITPEQKLIAEYWSDDPGKTATPPGHSMSIAKQILVAQDADLAKSVETIAKVGMGVHDAFVSCWKTKYEFNLLRPITYIKSNIDPSFKTILATPPFPEYTSGHSVQSGATAEILENEFGKTYGFVDKTHALRTDIDGRPRAFSSFAEFASEAAVSRLYGGIHFQRAIDQGILQGRAIGKNILKLKFK
jgi:hypothetical protein